MPANERLKGPTSQTICSAESTLSPQHQRRRKRVDRHRFEAGAAQNLAHVVWFGKRERTGRARFERRLRRQQRQRNGERHRNPRIEIRRLPADEAQFRRRPQRAMQIRKRRGRIAEEHHAETREQQIVFGVEARFRGVAEHERGREAVRSGAFAGAREHRLRDIDAGRGGAAGREAQRRVAAAAADVEHLCRPL